MMFFFACAPGIWEDVGVCESDFRMYLLTGFDIPIAMILDMFGIHGRRGSKVSIVRTCQNFPVKP